MAPRSVQLVLHYDGAAFHGWQRQTDTRTVQGELEGALARLCGGPVAALGAGRTDAGVHARGQAAGVRVTDRWTPAALRRALNAVLPHDVWIAEAHLMHPDFHARYSAVARRYSYRVGLDEAAASPFRRRWEWHARRPLEVARLDEEAAAIVGEHCFRAFAVHGTAPAHDTLRCAVELARWEADGTRLTFHVQANRFLHHMVRFLVGTMVEVAAGRRAPGTVAALLHAESNRDVAAPAPPHGLVLEQVSYPDHLYLTPA